MPYCPYCGAPTKDSDKYCIICGKPLLTDVSKKRREEKLKEKKEIISPKEESKKKEEESSIQEEEQVESDLKEKEEEKKKKKSIDEKAEEKEIVEIDIEPLPEDVKQKIDYFIEYSELKLNKDASLTIILPSDETFIVQKLNNQIDAKEFQLKNLTREYRLKKIDKDTFTKLKEKYKKERKDLEEHRYQLTEGIKLYIQDLKIELSDLSGERKLNKGRYSSKEIKEEEFKKIDNDLDLKMKKLESKINVLQKLSKT
ncbi:MAG: zinc ribbon domain-containing protein [Candidatus Lokiarchaeota archaeon]